MTNATLTQAAQFLQQTQLPNGSWPYHAQTAQGFPEPTCYATLALHQLGHPPRQTTLNWLTARVNPDGALTLEGDNEPNWGISPLILLLTRLQTAPQLKQRCLNFLLQWRSQPVAASEWIDLNGNLIGWGWISGTLGWVEPTSYAILALKANGMQQHERVQIAEQLLHDRVCSDGGWNVGNPNVLGRDLEGFIPPSAAALLALQGNDPQSDIITNGLHFLESQPLSIHSTASLAMTILCLQQFKRPFSQHANALQARQLPNGSWRNMVHLTALATLALLAAQGEPNVFQL